MRLSPPAVAISVAFVWGAAIFVIGGINSFVPGYGDSVLALVVSIYPGYDADGSLGDLMLGSAYALFDGLAAGLVFALLYNAVAWLLRPATVEDLSEPGEDRSEPGAEESETG